MKTTPISLVGLLFVAFLFGVAFALVFVLVANRSHNQNFCARAYNNTVKYRECTDRNLYDNLYLLKITRQ